MQEEIFESELHMDVNGPPVITTKPIKEDEIEIISGTILIESNRNV